MPDITMCQFKCGEHERCYRFIAKPNEYWQAYFSEQPCCHKDKPALTSGTIRKAPSEDHCIYFWEARAEDIENFKRRA